MSSTDYPGGAMTFPMTFPVYLDHAATTPMVPAAIAAMAEALPFTGNASSLHSSGRKARRMVEDDREIIADALGARPSEIIFTSGGTESDNLAVKGIFWARNTDRHRPRILVSTVEHHAVLDTVDWLSKHAKAEIVWLEVDRYGRMLPETLREALDQGDPDDIALVTVMWANNEVGAVNPVSELAAICAEHGVPFHTDAVQAAACLPVDFSDPTVNALTLTAHKLGGPYGVGALLLDRKTSCVPVLHGGGQEREVRSGTLDVPAIHSFAAAVTHAKATRNEHVAHLTALRAELISLMRREVPDVVLNGPEQSDLAHTLPGIAHFTFPGCAGDSLLMLLDAKGIECSTGSACTAGVAQPSHVLLAMGADASAARGSLRFSLGHTSTRDDVMTLAREIGGVVEQARNAGFSGMRKKKIEV
jgi:cysteine desulfurase